MTITAQTTPLYKTARNRSGENPTEAALANEGQRINVPLNEKAWNHIDVLNGEDRALLRWFHRDVLARNLSREQVGTILGSSRDRAYDPTTAYRVLNGTLKVASWSHFLVAIEAYRKTKNERSHVGGTKIRPQFINTAAAQSFGYALDLAKRGGFSIIAAPSGWGKTTALEQWDETNRGRMLRLDYPAIGGYRAMINALADMMGIGYLNHSGPVVLSRIQKRLSPDTVIVVDQGTRMIPSGRLIHDRSFEILTDLNKICGVLVALTWRDMADFSDAKYQIEQVTGRAEIFATPPLESTDIEHIAKQFGKLSNATLSALYALAKQHGGLRNVVKVLDSAHRFAGSYRKPITDRHVETALADRFNRLPSGDSPFGGETPKARRK